MVEKAKRCIHILCSHLMLTDNVCCCFKCFGQLAAKQIQIFFFNVTKDKSMGHIA